MQSDNPNQNNSDEKKPGASTSQGSVAGDDPVANPPQTSKTGLVLPDQILPPNLFVLPVNNVVVYPTLIAPIVVTVPRFVATIEEAIVRQRVIGLLLSRDGNSNDDTKSQDLHQVGVAAKILKRLKLPDGTIHLLVQSIRRFKAKSALSELPHIVVEAEYLEDQLEQSNHMDALTRAVISHVKQLSETNPFFTEEMKLAMLNAPGRGTVADLVAFALSLTREQAQEFLETVSVRERFEKLLIHLKKEQEVSSLQKKIQDDVNGKINTMQREFFLKEQLKAIKKELGLEEDDRSQSSKKFRDRIDAAGMPEEVRKTALEEVEKFESLNEASPEYNLTRNYLELLCSLPWNTSTVDQLDLVESRRILDQDHYGLEKVKDRIVQFLAVRQLTESRGMGLKDARKGSIICLAGPPGVGKTSVGKSIARTMGRNFYRFSLGGMRDEAEIRGHRRTYVGAMPGKIIQALKRAGTKNPVIMLDEIDKLGASFQGDPASALLEVLDPEQNTAFLDHYLDLPFDLSNVLFIATANNLTTIPAPLLDRMQVIEISGYTIEEKEEIARTYVIPKVLEANGIKPQELKITPSALRSLLSDYAREPGLRSVQQLVERMARRAAEKIVKKETKTIVIQAQDLQEWIGPKRFFNEVAERITVPGVVVGLAWTSAGGDILFIEANDLPGSGNLKLTGNMGEVMSESANIAWSYVKKRLATDFGFHQEHYKNKDVHLHIPSGAIPKDGPSAGVTMASALYSLLTGKVSKPGIAMTGELSLTGKVLPVGGIKEKLLAAKRTGITEIILPKLNEKDLYEIPAYVLQDLKLHFVSFASEVFDILFETSSRAEVKPAKKSGFKLKRILKKNLRAPRNGSRSGRISPS